MKVTPHLRGLFITIRIIRFEKLLHKNTLKIFAPIFEKNHQPYEFAGSTFGIGQCAIN